MSLAPLAAHPSAPAHLLCALAARTGLDQDAALRLELLANPATPDRVITSALTTAPPQHALRQAMLTACLTRPGTLPSSVIEHALDADQNGALTYARVWSLTRTTPVRATTALLATALRTPHLRQPLLAALVTGTHTPEQVRADALGHLCAEPGFGTDDQDRATLATAQQLTADAAGTTDQGAWPAPADADAWLRLATTGAGRPGFASAALAGTTDTAVFAWIAADPSVPLELRKRASLLARDPGTSPVRRKYLPRATIVVDDPDDPEYAEAYALRARTLGDVAGLMCHATLSPTAVAHLWSVTERQLQDSTGDFELWFATHPNAPEAVRTAAIRHARRFTGLTRDLVRRPGDDPTTLAARALTLTSGTLRTQSGLALLLDDALSALLPTITSADAATTLVTLAPTFTGTLAELFTVASTVGEPLTTGACT